jgi:anti-anti-sigma factor
MSRTTTAPLEIKCRGATAIISPGGNLGEFAFTDLQRELTDALRQFDEMPEVRNVVIDFANSDYFGSSALGLLVRLWKRVRQRGGTMAVCNLSEHETEILQACNLDDLWNVCSDRVEAFAVIENHPSTV